MRRHSVPRQSQYRTEVPIGEDWCSLSIDARRALIYSQLKSLGCLSKQQIITCLCGKQIPVMFAYRCFECGAWWCPKCSKTHFDTTRCKP